MTESPRKKSLARTTEKLLALALLGCAAALLLFALRLQLGNSRSLVDFMGFYTAATVVKQGTWSELYDTEIQLSQQQRIFGHREPTLVFIHPPFEALVLFPFAYMSYKAAYLSWNLVSLLVLICSLYLLRSSATHFGTASRLILAASMFYPVISTLREGQDSILLLLPYVGALAGLKNNRDFRAGCALGAGLFRFQLVLPFLLVFLMRRRWRFILGVLTIAAIFVVVSVALLGWMEAWRYVNVLWTISTVGKVRTPTVEAMPNLRGFAYTILASRLSDQSLGLLVAFGSVVILAWSAKAWRDTPWKPNERSFDLLFSLNLVTCVAVSYHAFPHNLVLLLIPALLVLDCCAADVRCRKGLARWKPASPLILLFLVVLYLSVRGYKEYSVLFCVIMLFAFSISAEISRQRELEAVQRPEGSPHRSSMVIPPNA